MDEIVKAALKKWPNVPHCVGWLALDARGQWYMRDDRIQAAGPFPTVKGSRIDHDKLREFIARNYERDAASGGWYFQNGPQRVYVELEAAPWVLRLRCVDGRLQVQTHTGRDTEVSRTWLDEHGRLFGETPLGLGIVHPQDMLAAADALEAGRWPAPHEAELVQLAARGGDLLSPQRAGLGR